MSTAVLAAAARDACPSLISRRKSPHPVPNACPEGRGQAESQGARQPHIPSQRESLPSLPLTCGGGEPLGDGWDSRHVCFPRGPSNSVPRLTSGWDLLTSSCHHCMSSASRVGGSPKVSQPDQAPETHLSLHSLTPQGLCTCCHGKIPPVPAMCPWTGHSLLGLRSLLVI